MKRSLSLIAKMLKFSAAAALVCLFLFAGSQAEDWEYFKLPGGVHHKSVFVDRTSGSNQVQALLSVCMSDSLCIKEYSAGWDSEWTLTGFLSTWGLDWVNVGDYAYVCVGGKNNFQILKHTASGWEEETAIGTPTAPGWWMHDCVFYSVSGTYDYDQVLACRTQTDDNTYGLFYWNGSSWYELDDGTNDSEGYGYRMWRSLQDGDEVYMVRAVDTDTYKIHSIDVDNDIGDEFTPIETITENNIVPDYDDIVDAPAFCQWDDGTYIHQYIVATSRDGANKYHDVWHRKYNSGWEDWDTLITDIDDDLSDTFNAANGDMGDIAIAARTYTENSTQYHRVYLATYEYGLVAYNTQAATQTCVTLNGTTDNNRLKTYPFRYLALSPIGETDMDADVIIYSSFKTVPHKGKFDWDSEDIDVITWDSEWFDWSSSSGSDIGGVCVPRDCYVNNREDQMFIPGAYEGLYAAPLLDSGENFLKNLGCDNATITNDADFNKNVISIVESPFTSNQYYVGVGPGIYTEYFSGYQVSTLFGNLWLFQSFIKTSMENCQLISLKWRHVLSISY